MSKIHDKVVKASQKPSVKKASKVVEVIELSQAKKDFIHNAVNYELEIINMDNIYNQDRAKLKKFLIENISLAMGTNPSYAEWNYIHEVFRGEICTATGMEFDSFDKNIWHDITQNLSSAYALEKPKSPNAKSEQKSEQRAKIDAMTDAELKANGKLVELAKREEKRLKNANDLVKQAHSKFIKEFTDTMKDIAKNEYDFAMYLENNLNTYREQFKKQK